MLRLALPATLCLTLAACSSSPPDPNKFAVLFHEGKSGFNGWAGINFSDEDVRTSLRNYYCGGLEPATLTIKRENGWPTFKGTCPGAVKPGVAAGVAAQPDGVTAPTVVNRTTPTGQPRVIY